LKVDNFIYFFTVCGFFIGLSFTILSFNEAEDIVLYTLEITLFFYLLVHFVTAFFVDIKNFSQKIFNKKGYEEVADYFIHELEDREKNIQTVLGFINRMNKEMKSEKSNKLSASPTPKRSVQ